MLYHQAPGCLAHAGNIQALSRLAELTGNSSWEAMRHSYGARGAALLAVLGARGGLHAASQFALGELHCSGATNRQKCAVGVILR